MADAPTLVKAAPHPRRRRNLHQAWVVRYSRGGRRPDGTPASV